MTSSDVLSYWRAPPDAGNLPEAYLEPHNWSRSIQLYDILSRLVAPEENPSILELGCNCGRNLAMLWFGGYHRLSGIEVNSDAIALMRTIFPFSTAWNIIEGTIEARIPKILSSTIVFTMAVLEHLPPSSEWVFEHISKIASQYLVTVEDEKEISDRHFPRRYDKVFCQLNFKQTLVDRVAGLDSSFRLRVFKKEAKQE